MFKIVVLKFNVCLANYLFILIWYKLCIRIILEHDIIIDFILYFIAENANNEIGASNECMTEDLAKEMKNKKVF